MSLFEDLLLKRDLFLKEVFELDLIPELKSIVLNKYPDSFYVSVEVLEPEESIVFNVCVYNKSGQDIATLEITSDEVYWD